MDNYRKGWSLRYMREAEAELTAAKETPYMAPGLMSEAMRKAQAAIYYSLGDPAYIEPIVRQTMHSKQFVKDPILRLLVEIERTIQRIPEASSSDSELAIEQVSNIVQLASEIVNLFIDKSSSLSGGSVQSKTLKQPWRQR